MNKKFVFNRNSETKAYGTIKTAKWAKGAVATLALAGGFMAVSGGNEVHAAEVTAPTTTATATPTATATATPTATATATPTATPTATATPVATTTATPTATATATPTATVPSTVSTTTTGNTTTVTDSAQQAAQDSAQQAGVIVKENKTPVDLGTASTTAEETAKQQEAAAKLAAETAALKEAQATHEAQVAQAQADSTKEGYLSKPVKQALNFGSEPNAKVEITGSTEFGQKDIQPYTGNVFTAENNIDSYVKAGGTFTSTPKIINLNENGGMDVILAKVGAGKTITGTYTNLENATFAGKKISKVTYDVTNKNSYEAAIAFATDPTLGIDALSKGYDKLATYGVAIKFYDENGNVFQFSNDNPAVLAITSLTKTDALGHTEGLKNYNFEYVPINGSYVVVDADGYIHSSQDTTAINDQSSDVWKIGGAGLVTSGDIISFDMERTTDGNFGYWLELNTNVPAPGVVTNPTVEVNNYQYETVGDVTTVHVTKDGTVLIPKTTKVDDGPTGSSYDVSKHDNTITTKDGKTYKFIGVTDNNKGTVKIGTIDVVFTYDEVFGTVTVDHKDTEGNELIPNEQDTPKSSTGTSYDTTDHKPSVITKDGKTYIIVTDLTEGNETGKVVEGNTNITYIYNELKVVKGVTNDKGDDINDGTLLVGEKGHYTLTGAKVIGAAFNDGKGQYAFRDDLDEVHDKYLGGHLVLINDITLEDGTVIKSGADLLKYAEMSYDGNNWEASLNSNFLKSLSDDSELQVQAILDFERIKSGDVENTFENIINGEVVKSNTVVTHTPEVPTPNNGNEKPGQPVQPVQPTAKTPVNLGAVNTLPHTGESDDSALLSMLGLVGIAGIALVSRKKRVN